MEFRKMVMITLYVRQQKRHRCINSLLDSVGEGEGGMIWENGTETCMQVKKQVRTTYGKMDWFQIGKGVCQGYILSPAYLT